MRAAKLKLRFKAAPSRTSMSSSRVSNTARPGASGMVMGHAGKCNTGSEAEELYGYLIIVYSCPDSEVKVMPSVVFNPSPSANA